MAQDVGGIVWTASMDTQQLVNGERQVNQSARRTGKNFDTLDGKSQRLNTTMTRLAKSIAGVFAVRQLQRWTLSTIAAIDEQGKFAQQIGVTFESLQKLQFAAEQSGASIQTLNNGLRRGSRNIAEAAENGGAMADAIESLGINVRQLNALRPDQQFRVLADAISQVEDSSEQARIAYRIFGRDGEALLNTLRNGSDGLRELGDEAQRTGRVLSQQAADDAAKFQDELNKLQGSIKGAAVSMGAELIPAITNVITGMTDWLSTGDNAQNLTRGIGLAAQATAVILAARLAPAILLATSGLFSMTAAAGAARAALAFLGGPVGLITIAAGAMVMMALNARRASDALKDHEGRVAELTAEYRALTQEQQAQARAEAQAAADRATARRDELQAMLDDEEAIRESARRSRQMMGGDVRGRAPSQDNAAARAKLEQQLEQQNRKVAEAEAKLEALNRVEQESAAIVEALGDAVDRGSESFDELRARLIDQQRELQSTNDEWEEFKLLQELGADATAEQRQEIVALIAGLQSLRKEREETAKAERAAEDRAGTVNRLREELALLEIRNQLGNEEYEIRAAIAALGEDDGSDDFAMQAEQVRLMVEQMQALRREAEILGPSMQQIFGEAGINALDTFSDGLTDILTGARSTSEALKDIGRTILSELLRSVIRYYVGQAAAAILGIGKTTAANTAAAATMTAAYTPAAVAANIASFGGAALAAAATAPIAATATVGAIMGASAVGPGRLNGGDVRPGTIYPITEDGRPEILRQGGQQYLLPGARGEVISNRDMQRMGGGVINNIRITNAPEGASISNNKNATGGVDLYVTWPDLIEDVSAWGKLPRAISQVSDIKRSSE